MTLKVVVRTLEGAAEACRHVNAGGAGQLTPAGETPVSTGLFSLLAGTAWPGVGVANWQGQEVRIIVETPGAAARLRSDADWTAGIFAITGRVELRDVLPTWRYRDPRRRLRWDEPGACAEADAVFLAEVEFSVDDPVAVLAVPEGVECFVIRRMDEGPETQPVSIETLLDPRDDERTHD